MASVERLIEMTGDVAAVTDEKIDRIHLITRRSRMLALNATIEASRVGQMGRGFAVVAEEVKSISSEISQLTDSLRGELRGRLETLSQFGHGMASEVHRVRGERLADLAHNAVEITDRNLYERSCDVRWWATDPAVVACAEAPTVEGCAHAARRLGIILDSYTVYLDLWIADTRGRVIATGRNGQWTQALGRDVSGEQWFKDAMATADGGEFAVADICREPGLDNSMVATYGTAIRAGGERFGRPIGALGIFFDWQAQGQAIVEGVRLSEAEKANSRCLLLDSRHRVIAASDGRGLLDEVFPLDTSQGPRGYYGKPDQHLIGYALTPGYETYKGLGWYGLIVQHG